MSEQEKLLISDQSIRVIDLHGPLVREVMLDPSRNYQPIARRQVCLGSPGTSVSDLPAHHSGGDGGINRCETVPRKRLGNHVFRATENPSAYVNVFE